ncbi:hypothetical protein V8D89_009260 [Ganoderma adspersum]
MHLNTAVVALVASWIPSILARSIPLNTRYRPSPPGSRKPGLQEHPTADDCMRTHDLSYLLESSLQTRFLVKSLEMEALQQMLGVYITNSPYAHTCIYPQPICAADHVWNPYLSEANPPSACSTSLRWLAKQGKCSPNETICGCTDGSADAFKCVGTETGPDSCEYPLLWVSRVADSYELAGGGCTVLSTVKGCYGSRVVGTDCAGISPVDAVFRISDGCAVQSCLARWSVDDTGKGRTEDQLPDTLSSAGQASQTTLSHKAHRVLAYGSQQNTTGADNAKPHARGILRNPDVHWPAKRDVPVDDEPDGDTHIGPGHMQEDWTRIPDYRRNLT